MSYDPALKKKLKDPEFRRHFVASLLGTRDAARQIAKRMEAERDEARALLQGDGMNEEKGMTCSEAGKKGGATTRSRYGKEHYIAGGQKGGATTRDRYGKDHYAELGRKGGRASRAAKAALVTSDE